MGSSHSFTKDYCFALVLVLEGTLSRVLRFLGCWDKCSGLEIVLGYFKGS